MTGGTSTLSVWATGQRPSRSQRLGRYLPASTAHPAKMLPAIAAEVIATFTQPGEWVADPMCGIGTTLVEAIHAGRNAVGAEYEPRWSALAADGVAHARRQGARGHGLVIRGDARDLAAIVPARLCGKVALVLTSPPYGASLHGQIRTGHRGVTKEHYRYSRDRGNLGNHGVDQVLAAFAQILVGCHAVLRPGGILAVTGRPVRSRGVLSDLPGRVISTACKTGFVPLARYAALICGLRDDHVITRASFFAMCEARRMRAAGLPAHVIAHEDLLILKAVPA